MFGQGRNFSDVLMCPFSPCPGLADDSSTASSGKTRAHSSEGEAHVHESDSIKSSYDVEEDVPPSFFQKMKGAFGETEDKLMPKAALHAKSADPHPRLTPEAPGMFSHLKESVWGKSDAAASQKDLLEEPRHPKGSSVQEKGAFGSNELGTGYEEDTEKGALSSDGSLDFSDKEGSASQSESLFKPVKENV